MSLANPKADYLREISTFLGKRVVISSLDGTKTYNGQLAAITPEGEGFVILKNVTYKENEETKKSFHKLFINSRLVGTIIIEEVPFDLAGLARELEKVFRRPGDVKLYEDSGLVVVLERVKVTEKGVEGSGPVADRVNSIYVRFVKEQNETKEKMSDSSTAPTE